MILGLQEYLKNVKTQTKQATDECKELRQEKESLLKKLGEVEEERNQLEIVAIDAENLRKVSFRRHLSSSNAVFPSVSLADRLVSLISGNCEPGTGSPTAA